MTKYADEAKVLVDAIREIANKPDNLDNLETYLSYSFGPWLEKWANSPASMADEMREFAQMII